MASKSVPLPGVRVARSGCSGETPRMSFAQSARHADARSRKKDRNAGNAKKVFTLSVHTRQFR